MERKQSKPARKAIHKVSGFTISRKLGVSYFMMFILILMGGAAGLYSTYSLDKTLEFVTGDAWTAADGTMELEVFAERQIIATQGAVIYPRRYSKYRQIYVKAREGADKARDEIFATGLFTPSQKEKLEEIHNKFNNVSVGVLSMMDDGDYTTDELDTGLAKLEATQQALLDFLGELEAYSDELIESQREKNQTTVAVAFVGVLAMLGLGVAVAFIAYVFNVRSIVSPLRKTVHVLRDISQGEGDLTVRMPVKGTDEIAQLAGWFNVFVEKLQQMVQSVMGSTAQLAAAAEEMSAITGETQQQVTAQRYETDAVAAAMSQMSATTMEVARNANEAAAAAETANDNAIEGQREVSETMSSIQQLVRGVDGASGAITELAKDSDSIGTVLEVIKDIAEQTNLLALNAAIEAARAGEQGRGFAVVADEVRTLASRTRESTEEIEQMVERFRTASTNAVKAMKEGQSAAGRSVEQSEHAKEALAKITESVRTILDLNAMIATASEEQGVMSEEVHRNITTINTVAIETEQGAIQTSRSSEELASLASQLQEVVNQFKV